MVPLNHYLLLSGVLFAIGTAGVFLRRNLITVLLPVFAWAPGATFTVPVFLSGKGEVNSLTLSVAATESITVPAGTFEVYRVEIVGGSAPVAMYVTTTAPHRLVKVAPAGAPLEFAQPWFM